MFSLRFNFFYDLLLYNNITQTFCIFRGFNPSIEDSVFTSSVIEDNRDVSVPNYEQEEAYAISYLRQLPPLARKVLEGLPKVLDTGVTYENSK